MTSRRRVETQARWRKTADRGIGISQPTNINATTLTKVKISFHSCLIEKTFYKKYVPLSVVCDFNGGLKV